MTRSSRADLAKHRADARLRAKVLLSVIEQLSKLERDEDQRIVLDTAFKYFEIDKV